MGRYKVIAARVNRVVDGAFLTHVKGEIVDLAKHEVDRLRRLRAVAPVDKDGNITEEPEPAGVSPHLEPSLEPAGPGGEVVPPIVPVEPAVDAEAAPGDVPAPRGNASQDEWAAYAKAVKGATDAELEGLGRDQIREKYGPASEQPAQ